MSLLAELVGRWSHLTTGTSAGPQHSLHCKCFLPLHTFFVRFFMASCVHSTAPFPHIVVNSFEQGTFNIVLSLLFGLLVHR
jgi:hypothetical protein